MGIRHLRLLIAACLLFVSGALSACASTQPAMEDATADSLRALLDGQVAEGAPGYAIGVVVEGEVVFSHYAGLAILDTPTKIDAETRFNIASVAKQYTALMVLDLARSGQIDLSADFRTYLPDTMTKVDQRITIAQMLTHTSGIRDVYDLFALTNGTWYESDFSNRTALGLLNSQTALNFEPGTDYYYSNSNYILLAEVIAAVAGEPFPEYADKFLKERGMTSSTVRRRYGVVVPRLARAYADYGSGWFRNADIANTHGDGFVFATLPDQLAWEAQVWGNDQTLPKAVIAESQAPLEAVYTDAYGFGLEFGFYRGLPIVYHEGATGAYNSYTMRFPGEKMSIITMGNTGQINAVVLARQIADVLLDGRFTDEPVYPAGPQTVTSLASVDPYLGLYELPSGAFVRLVSREGELFREIEGRDPVRLVREGGNVFSYETSPTLKIALSMAPGGAPQFTLYSPTVAPRLATYLEPVPEDAAYFATVEGTFVNDETKTEIILRHEQGTEYTMIKNDRPRTLELAANDYLIWNAYRIRVLRDEGGRVTGLSVDRDRIQNVAFVRTD